MQKVPQNIIDEIINRVDLLEVVGVHSDLKKSGGLYEALCPFHDEKTPSFKIKPNETNYHCHGCGAHGNAIDFIRGTQPGRTFLDVLETLAESVGIELPKDDNKEDYSHLAKIYKSLSFAQERYTKALERPTAQAYLSKRELSPAVVDEFLVGYAPDNYGFLSQSKTDVWLDPQMKAGLVRKNEDKGHHYDFFVERLMFPVRNLKGKVVGFSGRYIGKDKDKENKFKYINSPETELFKKSQLLYGLYEAIQASIKSKESLGSINIVEGPTDVLQMFSAGIRNTVASLGTSFSLHHAELLFKKTDELVFVMDGDKAGRKAAIRAAKICLPLLTDGRTIKFAFLADGEDPDSMVRSGKARELAEQISEAICITDLLYNHAVEEAGEGPSVAVKSKACGNMKEFILTMPDSFFKELFMSKIANRMNLSFDVVRHVIINT